MIKFYNLKYILFGTILTCTVPIAIVGCESSRQHSQLYQNQIPSTLSNDQIEAQKWDGMANQINTVGVPISAVVGPVTGGVAPLAVGIAGGIASLVAAFYANRAVKSVKLSNK